MTSNCFGAPSFCSGFDPSRRNGEKIFPENNSPLVLVSVFNLGVFASHCWHLELRVSVRIRGRMSVFAVASPMSFIVPRIKRTPISALRTAAIYERDKNGSFSNHLWHNSARISKWLIRCKFVAIISISPHIISSVNYTSSKYILSKHIINFINERNKIDNMIFN